MSRVRSLQPAYPRCPAAAQRLSALASARVSGCGRTRAIRFHQQARAPARDMRDDSGAAMELRDGAEIDGESELDLLPFAQTEIRGLDEHTRGTEIHRAAQLPAPAGNVDVDGRSGSVPGMQSAFHGWSLIFLSAWGSTVPIMPSFPQAHGPDSTYRGTALTPKSCDRRVLASSQRPFRARPWAQSVESRGARPEDNDQTGARGGRRPR